MIFGINAWIFWLILAAIFIVIEVSTVNLVSIWFALGSFAALIASLFGADVTTQIVLAVVISAVCVILIIIFKPFDKWKKRQAQATNSDRVVGQKALVVGKIDDLQGTGLVKVMGQMWSAASVDGGTIEEGVYVNVIKISGVKLIVEKID